MLWMPPLSTGPALCIQVSCRQAMRPAKAAGMRPLPCIHRDEEPATCLDPPARIQVWESQPHLGPPAGEHKVGVHVLLPELLGHVEPQRAVLVVDVSFRGVRQDGVGVVDLLKLVRSLWVIRVLVRVVFQGQLPANQNHLLVMHFVFTHWTEG